MGCMSSKEKKHIEMVNKSTETSRNFEIYNYYTPKYHSNEDHLPLDSRICYKHYRNSIEYVNQIGRGSFNYSPQYNKIISRINSE